MTLINRIRYTVVALALGLIAVILLTGCAPGAGPLAQSGPSSLPSGSGVFGPLDTAGPSGVFMPPTGDARNSCPSDAPTMLRANAQPGTPGLSAPVLIDWRPVANRTAYEVSVNRRDPAPALVFVVEGTTQDTRRYQPGVYDVRVRSRAFGQCGEAGAWSKVETFSVVDYPQPVPPVTPDPCAGWQEKTVCGGDD